MKDKDKTKKQLINELAELCQQNKELEASEIKRKLAEERIRKLGRLREELLSSGSLHEKLKQITNGVVEIFHVDFSRIWISKPGDLCDSGCMHAEITEGSHVCRYRDRCLHLIASSGRYTHTDGKVHRRVPFGCYKIGRVAAEEDPKFITNDVTNDPRIHDHDWAKKLDLISFAGYRLLSEANKPIGVLALFSKRVISPDEDALLKDIANTAAEVIQTSTAEEELRKTKDYLNNVIESSLDAIILSDSMGYVTRVNNSFLKLIGYNEEELIGKHISELTPYEEGTYDSTTGEMVEIDENFIVDATEIAGNKLFENGKISHWESYFLRKDRKIVPVEINISYLYNDEGATIGAIGVSRDITEHRQIERALRESHKELEEKVEKRTADLKLVNQQLMETKDHLENILESSLDCVVVTDNNGYITKVNRSFLNLVGYKEEETIGEMMTEFSPTEEGIHESTTGEFVEIDKELLNETATMVSRFLRDGKVSNWETYLLSKNKKVVPVDINIAILYKKGDKIGSVGVLRDITERKKTEKELKEGKDFLESVIESSMDGIAIVDVKGHIISANNALLEMCKFSKEKLVGEHISILTIKDNVLRKKILEKTGELFEKGFASYESKHKVGGENYIDVECNVSLVKNDEGNNIAGIAIIRDITERKRAEETLRKSEEKYQSLIEHANDAIISINREGIIIGFNKKAVEMFGYSREEILGKPATSLAPPPQIEKQRKMLKKFKKGELLDIDKILKEGKGLKKNGQIFSSEFSYYVLELHGEYIATAIIRDITERKKAEKKVLEYQKRLKSLTSQMTLNEEKERKHLADYLHDKIGQELFAINIKLELLKDSLSSNEEVKILSDLSNSLIRTIENARSLTFELSPPILYQFGLEAALEWLAEHTYVQYNIVVSFEDDKREKPLDDDVKIFLYQAVRELLTNVAKHAQVKNARVSVKKDNSNIRICVEDDGVGFAHPTQGFVQGWRKKGYGLFSIGERLDYLGGYFEITSRDGRGTRAILIAPLKGQR